MCRFFSAVVTKDGRVLFCEDDSHEEIVRRANLNDTSTHLRHWIRVEAAGGQAPVTVDESTSTPAWWDDRSNEWSDLVLQTAARVRPAKDAYNAAIRPAKDAYDAAIRAAWDAYNAAIRPAGAIYYVAVRAAKDAYDAAIRAAKDAYDAAISPAKDAYVHTISTISGYLPRSGAVRRRAGHRAGGRRGALLR